MDFEHVLAEEYEKLPQKFRDKVKNVALLVEDEPSLEIRKTEGLEDNETLLGLYRGIPNTMRGADYGVGMTMPDTITLYRLPIEEEAFELGKPVREVIYDTLFHEIAHYFGMSEDSVRHREARPKPRHYE